MIMRIAGLVLLVLLSSWLHPVHVSVTNVDIDPESGQVSVSVKLFSDDFENLIYNKYGVQLKITSQVNPGKDIEAVNRYMEETLDFTINGDDRAKLDFTGSRLNEQAIWLSYSYKYGKAIRKMTIVNRLMLEIFEDQTNLVIVSFRDRQNGYRLNNKNTELSINIK